MSTYPGYTHTGTWTNWSSGQVFGRTLTLTSRDAGLLSSSLSVFITLIGTQLWSILSFIVHQANSDLKGDTLHRQLQVILRNTGTAAGVAWACLSLPFKWRNLTGVSRKLPPGRIWFRSWLSSVPAILIFILIGAAGTLSSHITKAAGDETLIYGPNCGQWAIQDDASDVTERAFVGRILNESFIAANYARYCYGAASTSSLCSVYVHQQIKWIANQNASCPFADGICVFGEKAALQLDTGYVDSHWVLGINNHPADRVLYRRVTTCAPLNSTGRFEAINPVVLYNFGYFDGSGQNVTLTYHTDLLENGLEFYLQEYTTGFYGWVPIPELDHPDADISLFAFAPNIIAYLGPVYDPFFAATQVSYISPPVWMPKGPSEYVHFLACTDQHQFCTPTKAKSAGSKDCADLTSVLQLNNSISSISWNANQYATLQLILSNLEYSRMYFSTAGRGSAALLASETIWDDIANPLPNNQWMIEVSNWFATSLARLQHGLVESATGPNALPAGMILVPPRTPEGRALCHAQKVRDTGTHLSFRVFDLAFTFAVGIIIIITSLSIEWIADKLRKKYAKDRKERRLQWILDGNMQLLRMVHEYSGMGEWINTEKQVPTTKESMTVNEEDGKKKRTRTFFQLPKNMDPERPGWKPTTREMTAQEKILMPAKSPSVDLSQSSNNNVNHNSPSSEGIASDSMIQNASQTEQTTLLKHQQPDVKHVGASSRSATQPGDTNIPSSNSVIESTSQEQVSLPPQESAPQEYSPQEYVTQDYMPHETGQQALPQNQERDAVSSSPQTTPSADVQAQTDSGTPDRPDLEDATRVHQQQQQLL